MTSLLQTSDLDPSSFTNSGTVGLGGLALRTDAGSAFRTTLAADTGASLIGHIDSAVGAVATTVQARLRKMPDTAGGFWPDSAPVGVIQRLYDRVYVGGATAADGTIANTVKDWLETERNYTTRNSQVAVTSTIGQLAILGGSRTSDSADTGSMGCIGVGAYAINNNSTQMQSAYAGYFEARRKAGAGTTHGVEVDVVNQGSDIITNPFGSFAPDGMTNGLWIASGGEIAAAPASVAIGIVNNGAAFNSGIVFQSNSITGTDGVTGTGTAVAFAKGHLMSWYNSAGSLTSYIYSGASTNNLGAGIVLDDGRASFVNSGAGGSTKFTVEYGVNDVNYIGTVGAVAGLPANLQAMGADTDIDIRLAPKGAGVLAVTYGSDAATAPASFSATRRLAFKDGNNITWYIPISTVAW
jgi:hypothetical protein